MPSWIPVLRAVDELALVCYWGAIRMFAQYCGLRCNIDFCGECVVGLDQMQYRSCVGAKVPLIGGVVDFGARLWVFQKEIIILHVGCYGRVDLSYKSEKVFLLITSEDLPVLSHYLSTEQQVSESGHNSPRGLRKCMLRW